MPRTITCNGCENLLTEDDFHLISPVDGNPYCESCHASDMSNASKVIVIEPDGLPQETRSLYVGHLFREDEHGEEPNLTFHSKWVSTDAWRGYNETSIEGWTEILSGWTTGGWDDDTARRKGIFNGWAEMLHEGSVRPPRRLAIIVESTSNVFSMAVGVWAADEDVDTVREWIGDDMEGLQHSLS